MLQRIAQCNSVATLNWYSCYGICKIILDWVTTIDSVTSLKQPTVTFNAVVLYYVEFTMSIDCLIVLHEEWMYTLCTVHLLVCCTSTYSTFVSLLFKYIQNISYFGVQVLWSGKNTKKVWFKDTAFPTFEPTRCCKV